MAETKPKTSETSNDAPDVEEVCRQFESELREGKDANIVACIANWEEPERSKLLCELISVEIQFRQFAGRPMPRQEALDRFPNDKTVVNEAYENQRNDQTVLPTAILEQLQTVSHLRHLRFLAEGGLGQVFIAEDEALRRDAAVKLIREDLTDDVESCEQFKVEAEVTGRLNHPGIPIVYSIGQTSKGRLFYAMQYVRGTRLDKLIRKHHKEFSHEYGSQWFGLKRLKLNSIRKTSSAEKSASLSEESHSPDTSSIQAMDLRELLALFISVCHTIGYAHRRGILHRDIKPSNVIHGKFGETMVIDWGLALPIARQGVFKDIAEQTIAPRSGKNTRNSIGCIGTPAFMSPEQARGDVPLTPAADIFSLGTLLYTILTGVPPYQGQTVMEVRQHAIDCEFPRPSTLVKNLPTTLEAICMKSMRGPISERYRTTHEMVADIREYLADRPVTAHPDSNYRKLSRWTRHNTQVVLAMMLGISLIALTVGAIGVWKSVALSKEKTESTTNSAWAKNEEKLRGQSLRMAADLAASTLANKIDIIYRALELHSLDDELQVNLKLWNDATGVENDATGIKNDAAKSIQAWLDRVVSTEPKSMQFRSWLLMAADGTCLARTPEFSSGKRVSSIGKNFAFRDYFHGIGQDLPPTTRSVRVLDAPHNSAAIFSSADKKMTATFTVPILDSGKTNVDQEKNGIGALAICVECSEFSDLKLEASNDQQLLLVDARGYPMMEMEWSDEKDQHLILGPPQWSAGVLLHHENNLYHPTFNSLKRIDAETLQTMESKSKEASTNSSHQRSAQKFETGVYKDPTQTGNNQEWMAAYCPVVIDTRVDSRVSNTGWFVIVQQKMSPSIAPTNP